MRDLLYEFKRFQKDATIRPMAWFKEILKSKLLKTGRTKFSVSEIISIIDNEFEEYLILKSEIKNPKSEIT